MEGKIASIDLQQTQKGTPVYKVRLEGDDKEYSVWTKKRDGTPLGSALVVGQSYELGLSSRNVGTNVYYSIDSVAGIGVAPIPSTPLPPPSVAAPVVDARQTERRSIERQQALIQAVALLKETPVPEGVSRILVVLEAATKFAGFLAGQ